MGSNYHSVNFLCLLSDGEIKKKKKSKVGHMHKIELFANVSWVFLKVFFFFFFSYSFTWYSYDGFDSKHILSILDGRSFSHWNKPIFMSEVAFLSLGAPAAFPEVWQWVCCWRNPTHELSTLREVVKWKRERLLLGFQFRSSMHSGRKRSFLLVESLSLTYKSSS